MSTLRVAEIFASIQGESHWTGYPCTFVRLAGCNLECGYCDTEYARSGGEAMAPDEIVARVRELGQPTVEVTGGEPLHQPGIIELLTTLADLGSRVLLETNGSYPVSGVDRRVTVVLDIKTPGSGMDEKNHWGNLIILKKTDEVKFVLTSRADYKWARGIIEEHKLAGRVRLSLSPTQGQVQPSELADWMVADRMDARLQLQLHRILWPDRDRGV